MKTTTTISIPTASCKLLLRMSLSVELTTSCHMPLIWLREYTKFPDKYADWCLRVMRQNFQQYFFST